MRRSQHRLVCAGLLLASAIIPSSATAAPARAARRSIDPRGAAPAPVEPPETPRRALPTEEELFGCAKVPAGKRFKWSVRGEVGVTELVASLGQMSCQAIVVGPGVTGRAGKVALEVPDLLTAGEVHRIFLSSLETLGLTIERSGGLWKVVDAGRAKEVSAPLAADDATPSGETWVTRLIRLRHARAAEISDIVGRLRSKDGDVSPFPSGNALVVTDRGQIVRRMEALVGQLDVPRATGADRLFLVATHRQSASELAATLEKLLLATKRNDAPDGATGVPTGGKSGAPSSSPSSGGPLAEGINALVPLDASRAIVVAGSEAGWRRVVGLLERLDPPLATGEEPGGQAHVVYLANTNADDIAQTLAQLGLGAGGATRPSTGAAPSGAPSPARPSAGSSPASSLSLTGDVRIGYDKMANALVVIANGADFQIVRDLIARLDVPRRQVFVQATILDVSVDKSRELGLAWHTGADLPGGAKGLVSSSTSSSSTLITDAAKLASLIGSGGTLAGVLGPSMTVAGQSLPSFGVVLKALERSKNVHVISRPQLLTMDNVKSTLSVGQTFPVQTGTVGTAGASNSLLTSYGRQEVALKLELVPHLNDSDSVRLEISGEISDVPDAATADKAGGPITNKRTITTAVVVKDGEAVVLGGLQKESEAETVDKVPFLGDIPILGRLFQSKAKQRVQQDLLIVLQPYVIRGPEDLRRIREQRESEQREFDERFSAFRDEVAYGSNKIDWKRKRGLLEEIHVTARRAEEEAAAIAKAKQMLRPAEGPLEGNLMAMPPPAQP
jgi:general secretion pathway protein D